MSHLFYAVPPLFYCLNPFVVIESDKSEVTGMGLSEKLLSDSPAEDYSSRIQENYSSLTKTQKKIANYVQSHQSQVSDLSITQLARKTGTSTTAVTRFCQALKYSGFGEFKVYLRQAALPSALSIELIEEGDSVATVSAKLSNAAQAALAETYRMMDEQTLIEVSELIAKAGKVHLYGEGGPTETIQVASRLFMQAGVISNFFLDSTSILAAPLCLNKNDVAIGISYSGRTTNVLEALRTAKRHGAKTIAISGAANSQMSREVDYFLLYCHSIPDDFKYLHIARMCEIAILGRIQAQINSSGLTKGLLSEMREAVLSGRK